MVVFPDFGAAERIDEIADKFEACYREGLDPDPTEYLELVTDGLRTDLLIELLCIDASYRLRRHETISITRYLRHFPLLLSATTSRLESFNIWLNRAVAGSQKTPDTLARNGDRVADCDDPPPFRRFVGRFRLLHQLGAGGFGTVFRAYDPELDRDVAVKVPRTGTFATASDEDRFLREARGMAALDHPGIVRILDAGRSDEICFLVSQLVEGESLEQNLRHHAPDYSESARLIAAVADALEHAHQHGVVHRDMKPGNILLNQSGQPLITDFGTALLVHADGATTRTGELIGTPAYMAPEQATGNRRCQDHRVDVYALGVILYELLTGERPFRGSTAQILHQITSLDPPSPGALRSGIPRDLQTICQKAMSREVPQRYRRADDLRDDLLRFLDNRPIHARPVGMIGIVVRWSRRNRLAAALASSVAALLVATAILIGSALVRNAETRRQTVISQSRSDARLAAAELGSGSLRGFPTMLHSASLMEDIPEERASRLRVLNGWVQAVNDRGIRAMRHDDVVVSAAFKPASSVIATATFDRLLTIRDAETGQTITQMTGQKLTGQYGMYPLSFSSSGHRLMTSSQSRCIIYETKNWTPLTDITCRVAALSHDGRFVATVQNDDTQIVDIDRNGEVVFESEADDSTRLEFDGNGRCAVYGSLTIVLCPTNSGKAATISMTSPIQQIAFHPDGDRMAIATADDLAHVIRLPDGTANYPPISHTEDIRDLEFSNNGRWLATASFDGRIRIMDLGNGSVSIPPLPRPEPAMLVAFSPDSRHIACATHSGIIHLWTTENSQYLGSVFDHQGSPRCLEFSSDSRRMLTCGSTATVHSWKLTPVTDPGLPLQHADRVTDADFCRSEKKLATITEGGWLRLWNAHDGTATGDAVFVSDPQVSGDRPDLNTCRFHPREPVLAIGNGWGQLTLWDISTGQPVRTRSIPPVGRYNIRQLSFHPDGDRLMICSNARFAAVQGLHEGSDPMQIIKHPDQVWSIDVAPHGRYFATGCHDGHVRVFSATAPYPLIHDADFGASINSVSFSPDGRFLLITPTDRTARFIRCDSWQTHEQVIYGDSFFESVAFSPDGHRVATASNAGQIQVWDVETGLPCGPPIHHRMYASAVRFNPNGTQLVSTSFDRFARIHDVRDRLTGLSQMQIESAVSVISGRPASDPGR